MKNEMYSLSDLRDIVVPDAPPFWPPAPGVWVVLVIVSAVLLVLCWQWLATRKRNAYRRFGLALLEGANTIHDVSVVLKRVALAAFPREQVASLYGRDWAAFLNQRCSRCQFSETALGDPIGEEGKEFIEQSQTWIRHHRTSAPGILGVKPEPRTINPVEDPARSGEP